MLRPTTCKTRRRYASNCMPPRSSFILFLFFAVAASGCSRPEVSESEVSEAVIDSTVATWTFEAPELRQVTILSQQKTRNKNVVRAFMRTRGVENKWECEGELRVEFKWREHWVFESVENVESNAFSCKKTEQEIRRESERADAAAAEAARRRKEDAARQARCPKAAKWNGIECVCPPGSVSNGTKCQCMDAAAWSAADNACKCVSNATWDGKKCVCPRGSKSDGKLCQCLPGAKWDDVAKECRCPSGTAWDGTACAAPPSEDVATVPQEPTCCNHIAPGSVFRKKVKKWLGYRTDIYEVVGINSAGCVATIRNKYDSSAHSY